MTPLLSVESLSVSFGGLKAVNAVNLTVTEGEIVGLIGPNGAGKTSCIDGITGFAKASGEVTLAGKPLSGLPPHRRVSAGLARTWQSLELFDDLTVRENLLVAAYAPTLRQVLARILVPIRRPEPPVLAEVLELVGIGELADRYPTDLSQGQRKLVGVARALASRPTLVCMDEPAAGLDDDESKVLGSELREIAGRGTAILLIDHDMSLVMKICDRIFVMEFGEIISSGDPSTVRSDERVVRAYLGQQADEDHATAPSPNCSVPAKRGDQQ